MKRVTATMLVAALAAGAAVAGDLEERARASREAAQALGQKLGGALKGAMASGGPVSAIRVCNAEAPEMAAAVSEAQGWSVGRTSLQVRNPDKAPDAWEREVMERFEARKAAGEDPKTLEHYAVVEGDGGKVFRYMKAIPTQEICVTCHGAALSPDVEAAIDELYPEDEARGFAPGDLRGAFTITQPM